MMSKQHMGQMGLTEEVKYNRERVKLAGRVAEDMQEAAERWWSLHQQAKQLLADSAWLRDHTADPDFGDRYEEYRERERRLAQEADALADELNSRDYTSTPAHTVELGPIPDPPEEG